MTHGIRRLCCRAVDSEFIDEIGWCIGQFEQERSDVIGEWHMRADGVAGLRMFEGDALRVEDQSWEIVFIAIELVDATFAVFGIADDLMCEVLQVSSDLVASAGGDGDSEERASRERREVFE